MTDLVHGYPGNFDPLSHYQDNDFLLILKFHAYPVKVVFFNREATAPTAVDWWPLVLSSVLLGVKTTGTGRSNTVDFG